MIDLILAEREWNRLEKVSEALRPSKTIEEKLEILRKMSVSDGLEVPEQVAIQWAYERLAGDAVIAGDRWLTMEEMNIRYVAGAIHFFPTKTKAMKALGVTWKTILRWEKMGKAGGNGE